MSNRITVSIRAQYPATGQYDWRQALMELAPIRDIELAFHSPQNFVEFVKVEEVVPPLAALDIWVPTIHMAHARLSNLNLFMSVFIGTLKMAGALNCRNIVLHPTYGTVKDIDGLMDHVILPLLEDYDCNLLWETFSGKRRILTAWEQLADFCVRHERNFICYDVCHMERRSVEEVREDIIAYGGLIKAFHFSNWMPAPRKYHLPVGDGLLDFQRILAIIRRNGLACNITLEYLPEFHDRLVPDALRLREELYN